MAVQGGTAAAFAGQRLGMIAGYLEVALVEVHPPHRVDAGLGGVEDVDGEAHPTHSLNYGGKLQRAPESRIHTRVRRERAGEKPHQKAIHRVAHQRPGPGLHVADCEKAC